MDVDDAFKITNVVVLENIVALSCICETVVASNGAQFEEFLGVRGAMLHGDCGALRFLARVRNFECLTSYSCIILMW